MAARSDDLIITIRTDARRYPTRTEWIREVWAWAEANDIIIAWFGEQTIISGESRWHELDLHFWSDDKKLSWFMLRWSS